MREGRGTQERKQKRGRPNKNFFHLQILSQNAAPAGSGCESQTANWAMAHAQSKLLADSRRAAPGFWGFRFAKVTSS